MHIFGHIENFNDEKIYPFEINHKSFLLIHHQEQFFLIENKCGHFGIPLNNATIVDNEIICAQHGISFSLKTGAINNRPYENCSPIKTYELIEENGQLFCLNL